MHLHRVVERQAVKRTIIIGVLIFAIIRDVIAYLFRRWLGKRGKNAIYHTRIRTQPGGATGVIGLMTSLAFKDIDQSHVSV